MAHCPALCTVDPLGRQFRNREEIPKGDDAADPGLLYDRKMEFPRSFSL
jgi:hypothetical protein